MNDRCQLYTKNVKGVFAIFGLIIITIKQHTEIYSLRYSHSETGWPPVYM